MTMTKTRNLNGVDATWDGYELDFTMSMDGLSELINCFREFTCGTYQLGLTSVEGDSAVIMMEVRCGEGRLRVSVEHREVLFVGNKESMSLLVDNMEVLLSMWATGGGQHYHFNPSSDLLLLEPDSEAFILSPLA